MNCTNRFTCAFQLVLSLFLVASLGAGCSGCGGGATDTSVDAANMSSDGPNDADADPSGDGNAASAATGQTGHDHGDADGHDHGAMGSNDPWNRTYASPAEERSGTVENLNGLRATLVAELTSVRNRLKDGSRSAEDKKADSQRASELAQGLERLDRTIKQITEANDVSWVDVRESNMKAAGEFREWMAKYGMPS